MYNATITFSPPLSERTRDGRPYNNLTLNGLHDSAKSADEFIITQVNSRTKGNDTASGNVVIVLRVDQDSSHIRNITKNIYNSVNDSDDKYSRSVNANDIDSSNVVIVFGVEKDPTHIGNITKDIDNSINDGNDNNINSRRKDKSAIGVIVMRPNCVEMNGNDTASNNTISATEVEKDPVNISSINKNVDNSMNDNTDNKISVIIMDFGLEPPSNVSHVTYSTRGCVVGAVADLAIRKQSCLSGFSDADSFVFALSL